jgi:solute:Na+ symporter, SSS family
LVRGLDPAYRSDTTIGTLFPALPVEIKELNVGIVALAVNIVVLVAVSAVVRFATAKQGGLTQFAD